MIIQRKRRRNRKRGHCYYSIASAVCAAVFTTNVATTNACSLFVLLLLATSKKRGDPTTIGGYSSYMAVEGAFIISSTTVGKRQRQRHQHHYTHLQFTTSSSSSILSSNKEISQIRQRRKSSPQSYIHIHNSNYHLHHSSINNNINDGGDDLLLRDRRYSTKDWFYIMKSIRKSTILRDIKQPVICIFLWSSFVSLLYKISLMTKNHYTLCTIPMFPHSMVNSALGLLLVFRTNSAYQRFNEGRKIWSNIHTNTRNLSRLTNLYIDDIGLKSKYKMSTLLASFPYLLASHIQQKQKQRRRQKDYDNGDNIIIEELLFPSSSSLSSSSDTKKDSETQSTTTTNGMPQNKAEFINSTNRPIWVCDQLGCEVMKIQYSENYTSRERSTFLSYVGKLSTSVGRCERITQTSTPQNYARHALRSLSIWLATLPFALVKEFGMLTPIVTTSTAWLMFGVYQIGAIIEDPFQGSLKVQTMCDAIYNDVMVVGNNNNNNNYDDYSNNHNDNDNDNDNKNHIRESAYYYNEDGEYGHEVNRNNTTLQPFVESSLPINPPASAEEIHRHNNHDLHDSDTAPMKGSLTEDRSDDHITSENPPSIPPLGRISNDELNP